jgi:hypothetical protein
VSKKIAVRRILYAFFQFPIDPFKVNVRTDEQTVGKQINPSKRPHNSKQQLSPVGNPN